MMEKLAPYRVFTSSSLKLIAVITMFIDHFGATVMGQAVLRLPAVKADAGLYQNMLLLYRLIRYIGRIAFPIYCFLLVEGFLHTRNKMKYLLRLGIFVLISEIPFDYAIYNHWFYPDKQNVFFTLFFGMLVMVLADRFRNDWLQFLIMAAGVYLGWLFKTDYGARGVFLICTLFLVRYARPIQCLAGALIMQYELTAPLAFIPVLLYNGEKGNLKMKYFFYWFYPVHLLLLGLARDIVLFYFR